MSVRYLWIPLVLCGLILLGLSNSPATQADSGNLLINGNFDELPFDWFYPNHYVAEGWYRWWIDDSTHDIPEYDDVDKPFGVRREYHVDGTHAQVYFKWGHTYTSGIYQTVDGLTPCQPYELRMYARNHSVAGALPHARIGLDPQGHQLTANPPNDGNLTTMPEHTVWSEEQTQLNTWEQLNVTAEPVASSLTAILYASPTYAGTQTPYYDTFWDAGSLYAVSFPDERLPEPEGWTSSYITDVITTLASSTLTVTWNTIVSASGQVWYTVIPYTEPFTPTVPLTHTSYLPLVSRSVLPLTTDIDFTPQTQHSATISGLQSRDTVKIWILSRRPLTDICTTEGYGPIEVSVP